MRLLPLFTLIGILISNLPARATPVGAGECPSMTVFDYSSFMCMPYAMSGMPMKMLMVNGNVYFGQTVSSPPRGRSSLWSTSMIMTDLGSSIGSDHYVNLDLMLTLEKWTVPEQGYPLLLQIGESDSQGVPYLDAQHPHSSPIMGLTLSDTVNLGPPGDYLKFFFAPRGEATDGPIAFMHRPTGMANPDAPIGHHIGQDVGHISSTLVGASLKQGETRYEVSVFHGQEPKPERVDLPLGLPNSLSVRLIHELSPQLAGMISAAYVRDPEETGDEKAFVSRYSASLYQGGKTASEWLWQNALMTGLTQKYDHTEFLSSFGEEFLVKKNRERIWGRIEALERTPEELQINSSLPDQSHWVGAMTLGYSHQIASLDSFGVFLGASATHGILPGDFQGAYGGNPWAGKLFLQVGGMSMTHLGRDDCDDLSAQNDIAL